jgi:hypothetical protein
MLKDLLEDRYQLCADIGRRRCECWDQPLSEAGLFSFWNRCAQGAVFDGRPSTVDPVLQVDTGCK